MTIFLRRGILSSMQKIIIATNNAGKLREIREILGDRFGILSLKEAGIVCDAEETGATFQENAVIKARAVYELSGLPAIADDSGLEVKALGGAPGIFSARFAGRHGDDGANNALLLEKMRGVSDRACRFVSAVALYRGADDCLVATGETYGRLLTAPDGDNGFGYDPLFYSLDLQKSFGRATEAEKNAVSHRFRALKNLEALLCASLS